MSADEQDQEQGPNERINAAVTDALETIDAAADADTGTKLTTVTNVITEFVDAAAQAYVDGGSSQAVSRAATAIADDTRLVTKTEIKEDVEQQIDALSGGDADAPQVDHYIEDHLAELNAVRTTDTKQGALFRWMYDDPDHGAFTIETGENASGSHYEWESMRRAIFDASGRWTTRPRDRRGNDWVEWIGPLIETHAIEMQEQIDRLKSEGRW